MKINRKLKIVVKNAFSHQTLWRLRYSPSWHTRLLRRKPIQRFVQNPKENRHGCEPRILTGVLFPEILYDNRNKKVNPNYTFTKTITIAPDTKPHVAHCQHI